MCDVKMHKVSGLCALQDKGSQCIRASTTNLPDIFATVSKPQGTLGASAAQACSQHHMGAGIRRLEADHCRTGTLL